jgi:FMN-dependent NADH-azoreductase
LYLTCRNFGIPFHLKAWLDHVIQPHHTFDPATYQGLLTGKKAFVVLAAGGPSLNGPMDRAIPYMKQALGFIGISDVTFIPINGTAGEGAADAKAAATDAAAAAAGLKA